MCLIKPESDEKSVSAGKLFQALTTRSVKNEDRTECIIYMMYEYEWHKANVGSNEFRYILEKKNTFLKHFSDSIKTCYNEVNIVLAEAKRTRGGSRIWTPGIQCMSTTTSEN